MSSATYELAERYRQQQNSITKKFLSIVGDKINTDIHTRKSYWKMHRRLRDKVYPRGKRNIVLRFEGMI